MYKQLLIVTLMLSSYLSVSQIDKFNFLKVGDKAPKFNKLSQSKKTIDLEETLKKGKVIVVFYRGAWCPYCTKHLSQIQDSIAAFNLKGITIIAITPELDESIDKTIKKTNASFEFIHDSNYEIMNAYGVSFVVNDATITKYKLYGINLEKSNGNADHILPVPATFIINQNGMIEYLHFDENYKERSHVPELLNK